MSRYQNGIILDWFKENNLCDMIKSVSVNTVHIAQVVAGVV